ncbi:unnamed protein product, partial [Brassica oleracea]
RSSQTKPISHFSDSPKHHTTFHQRKTHTKGIKENYIFQSVTIIAFHTLTPDFGVEEKFTKCYGPCNQEAACDGFCKAKNIRSTGTCSSRFCCCVWQ